MPITTLANYRAKIDAPYQRLALTKVALSGVSGQLSSMWLTTPYTGATPTAPTSAVVPTRTTDGAWGQFNATGIQRLARLIVSWAGRGTLIIADRLSHQGGLAGDTATTQTTNLPTAALTRYTGGDGVWAAIEIYTAIGTTATTFSMSYTNQAGTSGRTSELSAIGATGFRELGRVLVPGLAQGDTGVRAVASVTLTASTLTAGNMGVTLFKPLMMIPVDGNAIRQDWDGFIGLGGQLPEIITDACLFWLFLTNISGLMVADVSIIEE